MREPTTAQLRTLYRLCHLLTNVMFHRDDREAFYAYMDRRHSRPRRTAIEFDDPAWEEKVLSAIQSQLGSER